MYRILTHLVRSRSPLVLYNLLFWSPPPIWYPLSSVHGPTCTLGCTRLQFPFWSGGLFRRGTEGHLWKQSAVSLNFEHILLPPSCNNPEREGDRETQGERESTKGPVQWYSVDCNKARGPWPLAVDPGMQAAIAIVYTSRSPYIHGYTHTHTFIFTLWFIYTIIIIDY